ncbi:MAG: ribose 5-phosphate isomerase B [Saprospiraceae bacterium]|nr:ribose 5-phosphate isomerase B [Saprospiraceae bacterium]
MKISIGSDHAGYEVRQMVVSQLEQQGIEVNDYGTFSADSVDYPDFIHPVGQDIDRGLVDFGIVICGSGNGAAMTANKHPLVRCALCWNTELAALARQHNNANVLGIPARFVSTDMAMQMVQIFLNTGFEGGRHQKRVDKISLC